MLQRSAAASDQTAGLAKSGAPHTDPGEPEARSINNAAEGMRRRRQCRRTIRETGSRTVTPALWKIRIGPDCGCHYWLPTPGTWLLNSRKEVIQPQVPLRLPCYDFTPVADLTVVGCPPCGLAHRLRVKPTPMV